MTESFPVRREGLQQIAQAVIAHYRITEETFFTRQKREATEARRVAALLMERAFPEAALWEIGAALRVRWPGNVLARARHDPAALSEAAVVKVLYDAGISRGIPARARKDSAAVSEAAVLALDSRGYE